MTGQLPLLEDLLPLEGKRVLVRVDFNVPIVEDPDGTRRVGDDFRIRAALATFEFLLAHGASVTACTHLGRPEGKVDERYSVAPVAARLAELAPEVALMENLRFDPGEEANDPAFVMRLVDGFDCFVNDAFGVSHRAHASVVGVPAHLPSAAGRLLAREAEVLGHLLEHPKRPFVAVVGGAKVADKLGVVHALAAKVDVLIIGGGMAYTFLASLGHEIGSSLYDPARREECQEVLASGATVLLPEDCVALAHDPERVGHFGQDIPEGFCGLDIGPKSAARFAEAIASAATVLWNGPMGVFEDPRFASGTRFVAEAVAACPGFSVAGGGDSVAAIDEWGLAGAIDHLSTGGGASLEMIEFGDLPGLAALRDAARRVGATRT